MAISYPVGARAFAVGTLPYAAGAPRSATRGRRSAIESLDECGLQRVEHTLDDTVEVRSVSRDFRLAVPNKEVGAA